MCAQKRVQESFVQESKFVVQLLQKRQKFCQKNKETTNCSFSSESNFSITQLHQQPQVNLLCLFSIVCYRPREFGESAADAARESDSDLQQHAAQVGHRAPVSGMWAPRPRSSQRSLQPLRAIRCRVPRQGPHEGLRLRQPEKLHCEGSGRQHVSNTSARVRRESAHFSRTVISGAQRLAAGAQHGETARRISVQVGTLAQTGSAEAQEAVSEHETTTHTFTRTRRRVNLQEQKRGKSLVATHQVAELKDSVCQVD